MRFVRKQAEVDALFLENEHKKFQLQRSSYPDCEVFELGTRAIIVVPIGGVSRATGPAILFASFAEYEASIIDDSPIDLLDLVPIDILEEDQRKKTFEAIAPILGVENRSQISMSAVKKLDRWIARTHRSWRLSVDQTFTSDWLRVVIVSLGEILIACCDETLCWPSEGGSELSLLSISRDYEFDIAREVIALLGDPSPGVLHTGAATIFLSEHCRGSHK